MEVFRLEDMWEAGRTNSSLEVLKRRLARYNLDWSESCMDMLQINARELNNQNRLKLFDSGRSCCCYATLRLLLRLRLSPESKTGQPSIS